MKQDDFEEWWNGLNKEQKEAIKALVIARIETLPENLKLSIG